MPSQITHVIVYSTVLLSLFLVDYHMGNGLMETFQKFICKSMCLIKKAFHEESKKAILLSENPLNFTVLLTELVILLLTIKLLNKFKPLRNHDKMDELLQESKEALRKSNEFLDKWGSRRSIKDYSYLDDNQDIELPVLDMAIIDTLGTTRSQPERGDAGDTINITDTTLLSVSSFDDDVDNFAEHLLDERVDDYRIGSHDRLLWDVVEEDNNVNQ